MKHLRKFVLLLPILVLAACTTTDLTEEEQEVLTPAAKVYAVKGEFNVLLHQINVYAAQPGCTATLVVACADPEVVGRALELAESIDRALDVAEATVRAGGDADANMTLARDLLAQLSAYLVAKQIGGEA